MNRSLPVFVLWCFLLLAKLLPSGAALQAVEIRDLRPEYAIGLIVTIDPDDDIRIKYLAARIEELLEKEILAIENLDVNKDRLEAYHNHLKVARRQNILGNLSDLLRRRDEAFLTRNESRLSSVKADIESQRRNLASLDNNEYVIQIIDTRPVQVKKPGGTVGYPITTGFLTRKGIDALVHIDLSLSGEMISAELIYSDFALEQRSLLRFTGSMEQVFLEIQEKMPALRNAIRGVESSLLRVRVQPPSAMITVNGIERSSGYYQAQMLPGKAVVQVRLDGYQDFYQLVNISGSEDIMLNPVLEPVENNLLVLQTIPSGVNVYADSIPVGVTPMFFHSHQKQHVLQFSADGYRTRMMLVDETTNNNLHLVLKRDFDHIEELIEKRRWNFYRAFGGFIVSLPVSFMLHSYSSMYARNIEEYTTRYQVTTIAGYGSIFVNITLFIQSIISLREYIEIADQSVRGGAFGDRE